MKGNSIILASNPRGMFLEGTVIGTPKPGTMMEIANGVADVGGEFSWQAYGTNAGMATGDPRLVAILDSDKLQGKTALDAYVNGTRCFLYVPYPGEDMNVLLAGQAGTGSANAFTIGERLIATAGTGLFAQESTSSINAQFLCLEHLDEVPNVATLCWAKRN